MGDLAERMHPGVGAAGALQAEGLLCDGFNRFVKEILDGVAPGLGLPSEKRAAVICDGELEPHVISPIHRFKISTAAAWSMRCFCLCALRPASRSFSEAVAVV